MLESLKKDVCWANKQLKAHGLVLFSWGNVSAIDRERNIIAIKPSGVSFEALTPEDIVLLDLHGNNIEGTKRQSSDTPTHIELYKQFSGISAVAHTHSTYATIFAQAEKQINCLGTTHADHFYGSVPVTRNLTPDEINDAYEYHTGKAIVELFTQNNRDPLRMPACLVSRHGPFTWGKTLDDALYHAVVLEQIAKLKLETQKLNPHVSDIDKALLDKHYLRKHGKDAYYGQK